MLKFYGLRVEIISYCNKYEDNNRSLLFNTNRL